MQAAVDNRETSWVCRHAIILALGGIMLFGLILRLPGMNYCFAPDESFSFDVYVRDGLRRIIFGPYQCNNQPFGSLLTWFSWQLFGESDWAIRLPAFLFGLASIPLAYVLGKRLFGAARYGLAAACFLAVSPYHVGYSASFRSYAVVMFFAMLATLFIHDNLVRASWWRTGGLALAAFLMAYSHIVSLMLLAGWGVILGAYGLGLAAVKSWRTRAHVVSFLSTSAGLAVGGLLISVAYWPVFFLPTAVVSRVFQGQWPDAANNFICGAELADWKPFSQFTEMITGFTGWFFWAAAAIAAIGLVMPLIRKRYSAGVCLATLACPVLTLLVLGFKIEPRYALVLHPFFALAFAAGVVYCAHCGGQLCARTCGCGARHAGVALSAIVVLLPFLAGMAPLYTVHFPFGPQFLTCVFNDQKSAAEYVVAHALGDDLVATSLIHTWPLTSYLNRDLYPFLSPSAVPPKETRFWYVANLPEDLREVAILHRTHPLKRVGAFYECALYLGRIESPDLHEVNIAPRCLLEGGFVDDGLGSWRMENWWGRKNAQIVGNGEDSAVQVEDIDGDLGCRFSSHPLPCVRGKRFVYRVQIRKPSPRRHVVLFARFTRGEDDCVDFQEMPVPCLSAAPLPDGYQQYNLTGLVPPRAEKMSVGVFVGDSRRAGSITLFRDVHLWVDWPLEEERLAKDATEELHP